MPLRHKNKVTRLLLLSLLLSSCAVGPNYHKPELPLPGAYANNTSKSSTIDPALWWKSLGDKNLDKLIDQAIIANPQLDIALTHLQEAREQEAAVTGEALPEAGASIGAGRGNGSDLARGRADQSLVSAEDTGKLSRVSQISGFDAAWEVDLFGKYRREIEAAHYDKQAAKAARNNILITVIADVVRSYVDLRSLQMQQAVLNNNIHVATEYVNFVQQRYDRGITNGLDLTLAQRELSTLKSQAAPLQSQIDGMQYTLAVLCGQYPENMVKELSEPGVIPTMPEKLDTGLPLDLLRHRPDIIEAERELASANAQIGIATANLFPHLVLTGGAGYQSQGIGLSPVGKSFIWSVGPSVNWALLDFGTLDAMVNIADLNSHAMLMNYKQKVLDAVREVDSAASNYNAQQDRLKNLHEALEASQQAVSIATQRYDRGLTDSLNVIDAERQQFDLEQQYVIAQQNAAEQFIMLYKALGSGWEHYQKFPAIRRPLPAVIAALRRSVE